MSYKTPVSMPGKRKSTATTSAPTLKDVAREAKVSLATASYVLNGKGAISKQVTERVMNVVKALGYQPNTAARTMKTGNSSTIGLLLPDFRYPLFSDLASDIEKVCASLDYSVFFANSYANPDTEITRAQRFAQSGADGLIWFPGSQKNTIAGAVHNLPVVVVDRDLPDYDVVTPDHFDGGVQQARHLIALGHKQIGMISGPRHVDNMQLRINGTLHAVAEKSANPAEIKWICETDFSDQLSIEAKTLLNKKSVSAIIAGNDTIALNIIRYAASIGLKVPDDLSVVGFDDIAWCEIMSPQLTSIRMPLPEMAEEAITMLLRRKENAGASRKKCTVGVTLTVRGSTQRR